MRSRRIRGMVVLLLLVLVAIASNVVWARSAVSSLDYPLTSQEQAARLWTLFRSKVTDKLYPSGVETIKPYRGLSGEEIGEQGLAKFAKKQGWIKLIGSRDRGIRQGLDAVYWDPRSGRVIAAEAKGGKGALLWRKNSGHK